MQEAHVCQDVTYPLGPSPQQTGIQQERFSAKHFTDGVTYWVIATPAHPDSQAAIRLQAASRGATRLDYLTAPPTYDFQTSKLQIQSQGAFPEHLARNVRISLGSQTPRTDGLTSNSNPISRSDPRPGPNPDQHTPLTPADRHIAKWPALPAPSSSSSSRSSVRFTPRASPIRYQMKLC